jgi:hypothetical protein
LLLDIGWGLGLIGVGTITLGEQGARWYYGLRLESFWIVVGAVFALGGAWELLNIQFAVAPILFIIAGAALLFSALRHW